MILIGVVAALLLAGIIVDAKYHEEEYKAGMATDSQEDEEEL